MLSLKYEQQKLIAIENNITSSDSIVRLTCDEDAFIMGIVKLYDGSQKIIQFIPEDDHYIARLVIDENDVNYLSSVIMCIQLSSGNFIKNSNYVNVSFDVSSVKSDIKIHLSNEYKELVDKINKLEEEVKYPASRFVKDINIKNKDLIRPGMIPVAVDDKGTFVAQYPFANNVTSVNGATAANGAVIIDATMIKYKASGKSLEETIADVATAIVSLKALVDEISAEQKQLRQRIDALDVAFERHINDGII